MAITIASLNDVYDQDGLFYWCNACGDVNMPGDPIDKITLHKPEELPPIPHELYDTYFSEDDGAYNYVVNFKGSPAYAFGLLFSDEWINDELKLGDAPVSVFQELVTEAVNRFFYENELFQGCYFLYGEGTDPSGCELLIIVPYEQKVKLPLIKETFIKKRWPYNIWDEMERLAPKYANRRTPVVVEITETYKKQIVILAKGSEDPIAVTKALCDYSGDIELDYENFFSRTVKTCPDVKPTSCFEAYSTENGREQGWEEKG